MLNSSQASSTQLSLENQKRLYSPQVSHPLPMNTQLSNQIMSMFAPYTQSPLFPMTQETSYNYTLQQKLQATKQKLKRNSIKPKAEPKRSIISKIDKLDIHQVPNGKQKKSSILKTSIESKIVRNPKLTNNNPTKNPKTNGLELCKSLNISQNMLNEIKSSHNLDSNIEINKLPNSIDQSQKQKPNNSSSIKQKTVKHSIAATLLAIDKSKPIMPKTTSSRNPKSVYIDLDSAAEQARLKSTILHSKTPEIKKTTTVSLSPAMLLSSCPGLSITPVVNPNDNRKANETSLVSNHVQNIPTITKNFNLEQFKHLGNSLTITKSEKNGNKKTKPELILID